MRVLALVQQNKSPSLLRNVPTRGCTCIAKEHEGEHVFFFCMKFYEASTDVPKLGWGKVCWCGCSLVEEGAVGTQDSAASRLGCLQAES